MSFNTAALYGCHQPIPSSNQTRCEPLPPRRPRASTMAQDANSRFNREYSVIRDDVNVQYDRVMAAIEQGMSIVLFARNVLAQSDGEIQNLLT